MILLERGKFYHIYNRGINSCTLFLKPENRLYFLRLYRKYIDPVADTFAWALMKNHFHLLVRIRLESEIDLNSLPIPKYQDLENYQPKIREPHHYFSDLFGSYTKAINKQNHRTGALFERPFRRLQIDNPDYFRNVIIYIHRNPEHHGVSNDFKLYPWSSYGSILSLQPTRLNRQGVIGSFNGLAEFIAEHDRTTAYEIFSNYSLESGEAE